MSLTIIENYDYPALIALLGMCKTIQYTYPKVDEYLQRIEKYSKLPLERRRYIVKNIIKTTDVINMYEDYFQKGITLLIKSHKHKLKQNEILQPIPFSRIEVCELRNRFYDLKNMYGCSTSWKRLYERIEDDLNSLDAFIARTEIK